MNLKFSSDIDRLFFINFSGYCAHISQFPDSFLYYMSKNNKISIENDFFCLKNFDISKLSSTPMSKFNYLISIYKRSKRILQKIPGVCAFSLCNSLALNTYHSKSDVDIFIILDKDSFFTTRLLIILLFNLTGLRPKVCLSFFISNKSLSLNDIRLKDDIYLANWLNTLHFNTSSEKLIKAFNKLNSCSAKYNKSFTFKKSFLFLETLFKKFQINRANIKQSKLKPSYGVVISDEMLKFHHNDIRRKFNPLYLLQYDEFLLGNHVKTYQQSLQEELI